MIYFPINHVVHHPVLLVLSSVNILFDKCIIIIAIKANIPYDVSYSLKYFKIRQS